MDAQRMEQKIRFTERLLAQLVERIENLQEEVAGPAREGKGVSAAWVCDRLEGLLEVEDPGGKLGTLVADERGLSILIGTRITGERVISTRPGDFNGVVWSEEMDR
jgi:hypothetical protein